MRVRVRLFAGLRELVGGDLEQSFAAESVTVEQFAARLAEAEPRLAPYLANVAIALNQEYVLDRTSPIHDGDEVALIQPIAGGAPPSGDTTHASRLPPHFLVTPDRLDRDALRELVRTDASGAVVLFEGVVRDHHEGHRVLHLEYEAYPEMAERQLRAVAVELRGEHPELHDIAIHHRTGRLAIGEVSLLVAVSAAHRHQAFAAAERAVDRVKETVPVWKKEYGPDGASWQEGIAPVPAPREPASPA